MADITQIKIDSTTYNIKDANAATKSDCWPIGSIYIGIGSASPATRFGGTWTQLSAGYALVTTTTSSTSTTGVAAETTGSTSLTSSQMPAHNHQAFNNDSVGGSSNSGQLIVIKNQATTTIKGKVTTSGPTHHWMGVTTTNSGEIQHYSAHNIHTSTEGEGQGHTHTMGTPAHIKVMAWRRTA